MRRLPIALMLTLLAVPAAAQSHPWLTLRTFVDADEAHGGPMPQVVGVGAAAGVELSKHFALVLEFDQPSWHAHTYVDQYFDAARGRSVRSTFTREVRTPSLNGLVQVRGFSDRRVGLAISGGLAAAASDGTYVSQIETLGQDGSTTSITTYPKTRSTYSWPGLAGGIEIPVRMTPHLWLVAESRGLWFPLSEQASTTVRRMGISARWRF